MTDFFQDMWKRYEPDMDRKDFSDRLNHLENAFFMKRPEYCGLLEEEQNLLIEQEYRRKYGGNVNPKAH